MRLENFQSHLDTFIEFNRGLNVIIGQSDSGKTSILRGLRWALFNQPRGSDFIRVGADFVRVTVTFSHGVTIVRERTPSKNRYIIKKEGSDDLILEGFGTYAPKEILDAHQMRPLRIERDQEMFLHIAQQLEGPFLLEQSPALRAKTIGRISGAHFLDMAIRDTSKDVQKLKQQISYTEEERDLIKEKLEPYTFLDEAKRKLVDATNAMQQLKKIKERKEKLTSFRQDYSNILNQIANLQTQLKTVSQVDKWEANLYRLEKKYDRNALYIERRSELESLNKNIQTCIIWVEKTKNCHTAADLLNDLSKQVDKNQQLKKLKSYYSEIQYSEKNALDQLDKTAFATKENELKIKSLETSMKLLGDLKNRKKELTLLQNQISKIENTKEKLFAIEKAENNFQNIERKLESYVGLGDKRRSIDELTTQLNKGNEFLMRNKEEEANLILQYEQKLKEKGSCPTCGNEIDQGKLISFLKS